MKKDQYSVIDKIILEKQPKECPFDKREIPPCDVCEPKESWEKTLRDLLYRAVAGWRTGYNQESVLGIVAGFIAQEYERGRHDNIIDIVKKIKKNGVYLSGETVRMLLKKFAENGAVGLVGIKVKADININ